MARAPEGRNRERARAAHMVKCPGALGEWELREIRSSRLLKSAYAFKYRSETCTLRRAAPRRAEGPMHAITTVPAYRLHGHLPKLGCRIQPNFPFGPESLSLPLRLPEQSPDTIIPVTVYVIFLPILESEIFLEAIGMGLKFGTTRSNTIRRNSLVSDTSGEFPIPRPD